MNPFKVGDKVRCIESISLGYGGPRKGDVYEVISVWDGYIGIYLQHLDSFKYEPDVISGKKSNWGFSKFELVTETTKKYYKWKICIEFNTPQGYTILDFDETEHYVHPDKIEDYIKFIAHKHDGVVVARKYEQLSEKCVEEPTT